MKGKDIITHAVRIEMPDMEQLRQNCIRQVTEKANVKHSVWIKRLIPVAACAIIIVAAVFAVPQFLQNASDNPLTDVNSSDISQNVSGDSPIDVSNTDIIGLPPATPGPPCDGPSILGDRIAFRRLQDLLFQMGMPRGFVFARVNEQTQPQPIEDDWYDGWLTQTLTLQVLSTVWCDDSEPLPQFITIQQGLFDDLSGPGPTWCCAGPIPLRKGGVYFLPLRLLDWDNDSRWYIIGSSDVLFEVDDRGKLYSHSQFPDFNRFDGEEASTVADAILSLIEDENFAVATSPLGRRMQWHWDNEIAVVTYGESVGIRWEVDPSGGPAFEQGVSYLAVISTYNNTVWYYSSTARVNPDGTISPSSNSVFANFYGYTVDEVIAIAERARAWHAG